MRRPSVLSVALACGIGAFCWTLIRGAPSPEETAAPDPTVATRTMMAAGQLGWPPKTLEAWKAVAVADPDDYWAWLNVAQRSEWAKLSAEAQDAWRVVYKKSLYKDESARDYGRSRYAFAMAAAALGMEDQAREAFTTAREWYTQRLEQEQLNRPELWHRLAWICKRLGDNDAAERSWRAAAERIGEDAQHSPHAAYNLACYRALLGESEEAIRLLRHAAAIGFDDPDLAAHDADLRSLHQETDFPLIVERMQRNAATPVTAPRLHGN